VAAPSLGTATTAGSAVTPEPAAPAPEPLPLSVEEFDTVIEEDVMSFVKASEKIGGLVEEQVGLTIKSCRQTTCVSNIAQLHRQKPSRKRSRQSEHISWWPPNQRSRTRSRPS
jgi:hypothetical protein